MSKEEILITVPRALLDKVGSFQGIVPFSPYHLPLVDQKNFVEIPRSQAEEDPSHKQLIVYFTVRDRMQFLSYWRNPKGGDKRLHGLLTMGFGGHVNTADKTFVGAVARELAEELGNSPVRSLELKGLINDDSNKVGEVHLGLYYEIQLYRWNQEDTGDLNVGRASLTPWKTLEENYDQMESWSKLVYDYIRGRAIRPLVAPEIVRITPESL